MGSQTFLFSSESVAAGHPDKMADQISDAILDAYIAGDPESRVACETLVTTGMVLVAGEISSKATIPTADVVRNTVRGIGYTDACMGLDADTCAVLVSLDRQSPDIAMGVDENTAGGKPLGAGDQGMMFGFACNETPELMPLPIQMSHNMMIRLAEAMKSGALPYLRPDGKGQVTVEYDGIRPVRVDTVVLSAQHSDDVPHDQLERELIEAVVMPCVPDEFRGDDITFHINPTGRFVVGGPQGDCGLTGRKIIVDTYGGRGRHGGGAFSGKDPTKVDRSAAYATRYVAKNVVAAGLADVCEIQIAYAIGVSEPVSLCVNTEGTGKVTERVIEKAIRDTFDLSPSGIIDMLDLRRPIFQDTAAHGHFGRTDVDFTWERTDKTDELRAKVGL